jgi:hypothetical protein
VAFARRDGTGQCVYTGWVPYRGSKGCDYAVQMTRQYDEYDGSVGEVQGEKAYALGLAKVFGERRDRWPLSLVLGLAIAISGTATGDAANAALMGEGR